MCFIYQKFLIYWTLFFIIAEKRWNQLTVLHVYHHTSVFLIYWLNLNVGYDGDVYLTIFLNGLIHTVMYNYYFVSLHTKDIWWKSALTLCQMVQFVLMNAQALYLLSTNCPSYPRNLVLTYLYYIFSLLLLFIHFYIISYIWNKGKKKSE